MAFSRLSITLFMLLTLPQLSSCNVLAGDEDNPPQIYALIVGITDYGDGAGTASKARKGAEEFLKVIANTYGTEALSTVLLDERATVDNFESALYDIRRLPPGSLVIIYFAGHGVREQYGTGSSLFLRLAGSTPNNYVRNSVEAGDLWNALTYTKRTNGMIFLDCCYAGSDAKDVVPANQVLKAGIRAFMMCACASDEVTTGDVFTNALIDTWREAHDQGKPCMRLEEFEEKILERVQEADSNYMTPGIPFRSQIAKCLTSMNRPSALLTLRFPKGCTRKFNILFNGKVVHRAFNYKEDKYFVCQIALDEELDIELVGQGKVSIAPRRTIFPKDYSPRRIIELSIEVDEKYVMAKAESAIALAETSVDFAKTVEAFGENPAPYYEAAAIRLRNAGVMETEKYVRKALEHDRDNAVYAIALGEQELAPELSWDEKDTLITKLERMGAHQRVAEICLDSTESNPDKATSLAIRALGNAKQIGDVEQTELALALLEGRNLGEWYETIATYVKETEPNELIATWMIVPTDKGKSQEFYSDYSTENLGLRSSIASASKVSVGYLEDRVRVKEADTMEKWYRWKAGRHFLSCMNQGFIVIDKEEYFDVDRHLKKSEDIEKGERFTIVFHDGSKAEIYAPNSMIVDEFASRKPGFKTQIDSKHCWIAKDVSDGEDWDNPFGFDWLNRKCYAPDKETAVEYLLTRSGFRVTHNDNGEVCIQDKIEAAGFSHSSEIDSGLGKLKLNFPDKEVANRYFNAMKIITLFGN